MIGFSGENKASKLVSGDLCEHLGLHSAIDFIVAKYPDRIAVDYKNGSLTYSQLNILANHLAQSLSTLGVLKGDKVSIIMDRSEKMILSILAILKLGCTYIPIDPAYPEKRINFIIKDSGSSAIVLGDSVGHLSNELEIPCMPEVEISLSAANKEVEPFSADVKANNDLAYIIYTSGSTGMPKGVKVTHANVHNYAYWLCSKFDMREFDSVDFSSSLAFDLSVTATIVPLLCGAKIQICSEETKLLPHKYIEYLADAAPTFIKLTPSYFGQLCRLLDTRGLKLPEKLTIILGGEALIPADVKHWLDVYPTHLIINEYGPTEATVATVAYSVSFDDPYLERSNIPIGFPAFNTDIYILDEEQKPCREGEAGELCISGKSVSAGYLNRPELNPSVFIDNPFRDDGKLYRTGDLARVLNDGNIEYLGRIDRQVKVRGFRIELGEIENTLLKHPSIDVSIVQPFNHTGEAKLIAYLKACSDSVPSIFELRHHLKKYLPDYMVPNYFIYIDEIPLTVNGKLDTKALPLPNTDSIGLGSVEAENETEQSMLNIWASVLNTKFGVTDDFFVIGGESINAAQIIQKIEDKFSVQMSLDEFYKHSNVRVLTKVVQDRLLNTIAQDELLSTILAEIEGMDESEIKRQLDNEA